MSSYPDSKIRAMADQLRDNVYAATWQYGGAPHGDIRSVDDSGGWTWEADLQFPGMEDAMNCVSAMRAYTKMKLRHELRHGDTVSSLHSTVVITVSCQLMAWPA